MSQLVVYEGGSEGGSPENLPVPHAVPGNVAEENQQLAIEDAPLLAIENGPVASEGVGPRDAEPSVEPSGPSSSGASSSSLPSRDEQRATEIRRELIRPGQRDGDNRVPPSFLKMKSESIKIKCDMWEGRGVGPRLFSTWFGHKHGLINHDQPFLGEKLLDAVLNKLQRQGVQLSKPLVQEPMYSQNRL